MNFLSMHLTRRWRCSQYEIAELRHLANGIYVRGYPTVCAKVMNCGSGNCKARPSFG
jgi:hypothetical protein